MGTLSPVHWVLVLVVIVLLFGPSRLAGIGRVLGDGARSLKQALGGGSAEKPDEKRS